MSKCGKIQKIVEGTQPMNKGIVYYLPLEPYKERYTELLMNWTLSAFKRNKIKVVAVHGLPLGNEIKVGSVLDAYGRSHYALTQMANLVKALPKITSNDVIYIDDMFTPGYEALPYILAQRKDKAPRIIARNHAQSVDIDDFTYPMLEWIRHYEMMVSKTASIICGSTIHKEAMLIAGWNKDIHVLGLPFSGDDVRKIAGSEVPWDKRNNTVVYSSRFDKEKQPEFFLDLVASHYSKFDFVVCTGASELRGEERAVRYALRLEKQGKLIIKRNCTKKEYYTTLANAKVQFNCARQDFVSYTMLEASALGTPTVAPCFRSFPEALYGNPNSLYTCFNKQDAIEKIANYCSMDEKSFEAQMHVIQMPSIHHSLMLDRLAQLIKEGW